MKEFYEQKVGEGAERLKLLGTFVNEIYGLAMRLKMSKPQRIRKYLEREDVQKRHTPEEKQKLMDEIEGLDEKVEKINDAVDRYNSTSGSVQGKIKEEILEQCDGIIDLLYGDDLTKGAIKKNIR